jgi:plastocyanin
MRFLALLALSACVQSSPLGRATETPAASSMRTIEIAVTSHGFDPSSVDVTMGETVTIVFTRKVQRTCVKRVVVALDDQHNVERDLQVDHPVALTLKFDRAGEVGFSCAMMMQGGAIHVRER